MSAPVSEGGRCFSFAALPRHEGLQIQVDVDEYEDEYRVFVSARDRNALRLALSTLGADFLAIARDM